MPHFMLNANREGMRDSKKEDRVNYMPPSNPPYIVNVNGEVIGIIEEKEDLPYVIPKPKPPLKDYNRVRVSWTW